jgi:hypothetical protein
MYTDVICFISTEYAKKNYPTLSTMLEDKVVDASIITAQELYIIPALGTSLYNDLQSVMWLYKNSGTTINADYVNLINNYIKPCLLHFTMWDAFGKNYLKMTSIGAQKKSSEFSQAGDSKDITFQRNIIKSDADAYHKRLIDHLCAYSSTYTLYNAPFTGDGVVGEIESSSGFGIFLG